MKDKNWKVQTDAARINSLSQRMFNRNLKNDDLVTAAQMRAFALEVLNDFDYREWRGKELEKPQKS